MSGYTLLLSMFNMLLIILAKKGLMNVDWSLYIVFIISLLIIIPNFIKWSVSVD